MWRLGSIKHFSISSLISSAGQEDGAELQESIDKSKDKSSRKIINDKYLLLSVEKYKFPSLLVQIVTMNGDFHEHK